MNLLTLALSALLGAFSRGSDVPRPAETPVEYTVALREPQTQMVEISMSIRGLAPDQGALEIALPVWRPGRYVVLDPAGTVRDVRARSGRGKPLPCAKVEKSAWMVRTGVAEGDDEVIVDYRIYANSLADRTRHVDDTHAFLDPATTLMYAPEFRDRALRVRIEAPEGWTTATGLDPDPADPATLLAPDYDTLADSPLEIGIHSTLDFHVDGVKHALVVWTGRKDAAAGLGPEFRREKIVEQFTKVIRTQRDIFGDFPFRRYVFLLHCCPGVRGGAEHLNSTVLQTSPTAFADEAGFRRFMGLVSHEYFHSWNVKQLRPAGLKAGPRAGYDFQHENYTDLLWVAEGTTSYYDDLCLVRAGILKPDDYLKSLSTAIDAIRNRPGAAVQSVAESSFDAWIKFNHTTPDSVNSTVSFYDKGALVSLLLDLEIRRRSDGTASLDSVMREMYRSFPLDGPGYTREDLLRCCERLSGSGFARFFAEYVDGVRPLEFETGLTVAGLEVSQEPARDSKEHTEEQPGAPKQRAYIGINLEAKDGLASVTSVAADGPAYKAGVIAGDVVLALNGQRVRAGELDALLKRIEPGEAIHLTLFRYDRIRELDLKADGRPEGKWTVKRVKEPTDQQKAVYEAWLGQKWPQAKVSPPDEAKTGETP